MWKHSDSRCTFTLYFKERKKKQHVIINITIPTDLISNRFARPSKEPIYTTVHILYKEFNSIFVIYPFGLIAVQKCRSSYDKKQKQKTTMSRHIKSHFYLQGQPR